MNKHNHSQRGDLTVVLAIILGLVIIGALVWVVWLRPLSEKNSAVTQSTQTNQTKTPTTNKTATTDSSSTSTTNSTELPGVTYVAVDKWAIKVPVLDGMGGFVYSIDANAVMAVRSKVLNNLSGTCTDNSVHVARGKAEDKVIGEMGLSDTTFKQAYDSTDVSTITTRSIKAHVGDYYYVVPGFSGASCVGASQADQQKELDAEIAIVKALNQMIAQ